MFGGRENWLLDQVRERNLQSQGQVVALATLATFVSIIIGALYLTQVAAQSTTGRQLADLRSERDELQQVNEQLRTEIAELRSVPRLLTRAEELGFVIAGPEQIEYLVVEGYNPNRVPVTTLLQKEEAEETTSLLQYDETFTGWARMQFDRLRSQFAQFTNPEDEQPIDEESE